MWMEGNREQSKARVEGAPNRHKNQASLEQQTILSYTLERRYQGQGCLALRGKTGILARSLSLAPDRRRGLDQRTGLSEKSLPGKGS